MYKSHGLDPSPERAGESSQPEKRAQPEEDNLGAELAKLGLSAPTLDLGRVPQNIVYDYPGKSGHNDSKASGIVYTGDPSNLNNSVFSENSGLNWEQLSTDNYIISK